MASNDEEIEDLTTCSVCFLEYDDHERKPKFLNCFHTVCLQCLQQIGKDGHILCPLCRSPTPCPQGVTQLRNNQHAYHMAQLRKKLGDSTSKQCWCLTCASPAALQCKRHETVPIPPNERNGGQVLQSAVNEYKITLAGTIEKRRGLQANFQEILKHLKSFESVIQSQAEENEIGLAELMSALDSADKKSNSVESYEAMKSRIVESNTEKKKELSAISDQLKILENEKHFQVKIHLETSDKRKVPTLPLFENGFCAPADDAHTEDRQDFALLSRLIFSILRKRKIRLEPQGTLKTPEQAPSKKSIRLLQPPQVRSLNKTQGGFVSSRPLLPAPAISLQNSAFILKVHEGGNFIGDILIRPSLKFDRNFLNYLGENCVSLATFHSLVVKATRESQVTLNFGHGELRPPVPNWSNEKPKKPFDVALTRVLTENNRVLSWDLLFLMEEMRLDTIPSSCLLGHVVQGNEVVRSLGQKSEGYRLTVVWQVTG